MGKIFYVAGARPQFMQAAMVSKALLNLENIDFRIIHTGQHFDSNMSRIFFDELEIPKPYRNLDVHSLKHGAMVGRIMEKLEELVIAEKPDALLVDGDTNSTLAGALVAAKLRTKSVHIESGLRSFDAGMPEEINRVLTDNCCTHLYCPTETSYNNLKKANLHNKAKIVGDVLYDAFCYYLPHSKGKAHNILKESGLNEERYVLLTLHREENTENRKKMSDIFQYLSKIDYPVLFPVHPRTEQILKSSNISLADIDNIRPVQPVGYLDMLDLERNSSFIITDSGGVQREAYWSKKPVFVLRNTSEWIEQLDTGWSVLIRDEDVCNIRAIIEDSLTRLDMHNHPDFYGDGRASQKIAEDIGSIIQ